MITTLFKFYSLLTVRPGIVEVGDYSPAGPVCMQVFISPNYPGYMN